MEKYIIEQVKSRYPDHKFIGEESYAGGEVVDLTDEPTWIVDPIGECEAARGTHSDVADPLLMLQMVRILSAGLSASSKLPADLSFLLQGTTNFVHQFDHVACSIGFTYKRIPVIG